MKKIKKTSILVVGIALVFLVLLILTFFRKPDPPTATLTVSMVFLGMQDNPVEETSDPGRTILCKGATGRCAMFKVTNTRKGEYVHFDTISVEQEVEGEWREFVPTGGTWESVSGGRFNSGYGCVIAIGWPPGLPENTRWRLRLECGLETRRKRLMSPIEMIRRRRLTQYTYTPEPAANIVSSSVVEPKQMLQVTADRRP